VVCTFVVTNHLYLSKKKDHLYLIFLSFLQNTLHGVESGNTYYYYFYRSLFLGRLESSMGVGFWIDCDLYLIRLEITVEQCFGFLFCELSRVHLSLCYRISNDLHWKGAIVCRASPFPSKMASRQSNLGFKGSKFPSRWLGNLVLKGQ
jgi:hypothetical protein